MPATSTPTTRAEEPTPEDALAALKKQEAAGGVADKLEMLQLKAVAQRDYRASYLADLDAKLERNAVLRQAAIDAAAAAAAAAAAEE